MISDNAIQCIKCGKYNSISRFPYGLGWLCSCGYWKIEFFINGRVVRLRSGDEEEALECIGKIAKILRERVEDEDAV